jgi:SAM-dependent methyltransferase
LLTLARGSLSERADVVAADLGASAWLDELPFQGFDAVLTATALHWIAPDRLRTLYAEIRGVLRDGGVFINADHMEDDGLPTLSAAVGELSRQRREAAYAGGTETWPGWWERFGTEPAVADLVRERNELFGGDHAESDLPPVSWHLNAMQAAGFTETGLIWRGHRDAAFAALR